jgi:FkbM family methyltransferase
MSDTELLLRGQPLCSAELKFYCYLGFKEEELGLLDNLVAHGQEGEPGFIRDAYGVRTRVSSLWPDMQAFDGKVWDLPIPGNWHWETTEWLAVMRSVLQAGDRYRIMELGAGWGPAVVSGLSLARRRGVADVKAMALEADPHHYATLRQHFADNGFDLDQHAVLNAAVGKRNGTARWPVTEENDTSYGNRPLGFLGRDYLGRRITKTRPVKVRGFKGLLKSERFWDLVHIDVQGGEFAICKDAIGMMNRRVGRVCLGLHSRKLDGDIFDLFWRAGWTLEGESPTRFHYRDKARSQESMTYADGTQVWRNPRLRPELKAAAG